MVLAAHDVRDARVEVVDGDGEVVEHGPVGAGDHGVVHVRVLEAGVAAHDVVHDGGSLVGHAQAHRALPLFAPAEPALGAVLALVGGDVLGGGVGAVGAPGVEQRA